MQAFAGLLHYWATDKKSRQELNKNRERLKDFRKALLDKEYGVHIEDVPYEFLYVEYQITKYTATQARKSLKGRKITSEELEGYKVSYLKRGTHIMHKYLPISPTPPTDSKELYSAGGSPHKR